MKSATPPLPVTSDVREGWYVPMRTKRDAIRPRWVLGCIKGMVCYGTGGTRHGHCKIETFRKWIKRTAARMTVELK